MAVQKVKIKLQYDTEHGGETVPAGETIEVWPDQAKRIRDMHAKRKAGEKAAANN